MTEGKSPRLKSRLFARKGEAMPAPSVGYVGVTELEGRFNRRKTERSFEGPERRHGALRRLLDAIGGEEAGEGAAQRAPAEGAPASQPAPLPLRPAAQPMGSLAALIQRRCKPGPAPATETAAPRASEGPSPPPQPAAAEPAPETQQRVKRRQLTVRLGPGDYRRFTAFKESKRSTNQQVLTEALRAYLERVLRETSGGP